MLCVLMAAMCGLAGCGSDEKVISKPADNVAADSGKETGDGENQGTGDAQSGSQEQDESTYTGYVFTSKDVDIKIDGKAAPILSALGEPTSYFESPSCAFGDLDKIYTFPGFELDTYSLEGVDYVSAVILMDDSVSTPEGICIGDTVDKVKQIYGEPKEEQDTVLKYTKGEMNLQFLLQSGAVASVEYVTKKLEE